ncbi:MAG: hypothetical protein ACTSUE_07075 [Promethearchaeota archaeon]
MSNKKQQILFVIVYVLAFGLIGFGTIYLLGSAGLLEFLIPGIVLVVIGMVLIVGVRLRQRVVIEQKITLKPTNIKQFKCKECGGELSQDDVVIKNDVVIVKCQYCGALYEMSDEPIW